jgi:predicted ArsR family transcriptional regulator
MAESTSIDDFPASRACSRILAALARQGGLTRKELAAAAYVGETTLSGGGYLQQLRQRGLIHVSGWRRSASGSFSIPQFALGAGPDFPRPTINLANRAAAGMERLVEAIRAHGPLDYRQAAAAADLSPNTVKNAGYLDALLEQERIHVDSWQRGRRGAPRALYMAGSGANAPRPGALSPQEKSRAFRQRKLAASAADCFADQLRLYLSRRPPSADFESRLHSKSVGREAD